MKLRVLQKNSTAAQLGQSIQTMASQLLASHLLDDDSMVEADIGTPPKIKSQLEQKYKQSGDGHGVAVPVIIEEGEDVEKTIEKMDRVGPGRIPPPVVINKTSIVHSTSRPQSSTPSDGFSTWILLSGSNTTSHPAVNKKNKPSFITTTKPITTRHEQNKLSSFSPYKKPTITPMSTSTITPSVTRPSTYFTRIVTSNPPPQKMTSKPVSSESNHTYSQVNVTTAKPLLPTLTRRPNPAPVNKLKNQTRLEAMALSARRKPTTTSTTTTNKPQVTDSPYKEEVAVSVTPEPTEDSTGPAPEEANATTKRTRRPGSSEKKKRKKNKNRHRQPTKQPDELHELESKITDEDANVSDVAATKERPLSTRIYNYLAREVMPSVGVGLLGLVFTAGLAGLIMYPFGGGAARKSYEELQTSQGAYYGYNSEVDREGGMSDAEAFGKVLAGMKDDQMSSYNNVGGVSTVYGSHQETRYGDAASRYAGGRVDSSQESGYSHGETKQNFGSSQSAQNEKFGEDYSRNKYPQTFPVYNNRGIRYRQVGIGSSYPVNHQVPETQEVTLEDKITPVALNNDRLLATSKTPSVQRGPLPQQKIEHGPRSLNRRRRDVIPDNNEIDNEIVPSIKDENKNSTMNSTITPTNISEIDRSTSSSTTVLPAEKPKNITGSNETSEENMIGVSDLQDVLEMETTTDIGTSEETTFIPATVLSEDVFSSGVVTEESDVTFNTSATKPPEPFSLFGLVRQLIQFKVQLGLNLLRNSSAAFTRYLDQVQKRMSASYRNNVKRSANIQEIRNRTMLRRIASRNV
ncbi:hypothetical protein PR048_028610 [Dryococelus australis]|uniref:Uncharacterized protein n=1 Tax=Dryococelus australis TaxID=614101 RepID=A0ABQ9GB18_9NEOP|nr:hypothetical protein PR048_028610 [Dryococelus australis]